MSGPVSQAEDACSESAPKVSVCICTLSRPHVAETIKSVLDQEGLDGCAFEIIVADDDPKLSAQRVVQEMAEKTSIPVRYVPCGARNVAVARNACLDAARGDWIAFIDDDERADPGWLASLLSAQKAYGADVVKGMVRGIYPAETPIWIKIADPFTRDYGPTGQTPKEMATGNVFFRRALAAPPHHRFDPAFGRTGGEDTDFFRRLTQMGARIVACREAVVDEVVPVERVSLVYLSGRARRLGQIEQRKQHLYLAGDYALGKRLALA